MQRECTAGLAAAALAQGDVDEAVSMVEGLLPWLDARGVEGGVDPAQVFVACVRVLDAAGDPRADDARRASRSYLAEMVGRIDDPELAARLPRSSRSRRRRSWRSAGSPATLSLSRQADDRRHHHRWHSLVRADASARRLISEHAVVPTLLTALVVLAIGCLLLLVARTFRTLE